MLRFIIGTAGMIAMFLFIDDLLERIQIFFAFFMVPFLFLGFFWTASSGVMGQSWGDRAKEIGIAGWVGGFRERIASELDKLRKDGEGDLGAI